MYHNSNARLLLSHSTTTRREEGSGTRSGSTSKLSPSKPQTAPNTQRSVVLHPDELKGLWNHDDVTMNSAGAGAYRAAVRRKDAAPQPPCKHFKFSVCQIFPRRYSFLRKYMDTFPWSFRILKINLEIKFCEKFEGKYSQVSRKIRVISKKIWQRPRADNTPFYISYHVRSSYAMIIWSLFWVLISRF